MKREIKFRAWDSVSHRFASAYDTVYMESEGEVVIVDTIGGLNRVSYDIQLFTGLKDKNGKEIYEGDIVQWEDTIDDGYGCGYLTTIQEVVTFGGGAYNPVSAMPSKYFEVIGNIYENPELLNK